MSADDKAAWLHIGMWDDPDVRRLSDKAFKAAFDGALKGENTPLSPFIWLGTDCPETDAPWPKKSDAEA